MNADEIKRLREIAGRCPRGPWNSLGFDEDFTRAEAEVRDPLGRIMARVPLHRRTEVGVDVAEMIARLDPQTVLALLDRLDALEAESAKSKDAVRLALRLAMRDFSEDHYCAGWNSGLDELIASNDCEKAKSVKALADLCGGWWRWDYEVERECFVPMDEWRKLAALAPSDSSGARKESQ